jgi:hypothetical protein
MARLRRPGRCRAWAATKGGLHRSGSRGSVSSTLAGVCAPTPAPPAPPSVRTATGWLLRNPARLTADEQRQLDALTAACPALAATREHVTAFAAMMLNRQGQHLEAWMNSVQADNLPELHSFVSGLRRDFDAARAGLTLSYSSGPVEGHVNRIK